MHMPLLHEPHMHFPAIQILPPIENAAESKWESLVIEQDLEDTENFQNGACVTDKNLQ